MSGPDIYLEIRFDIKKDTVTIRTNANPRGLEEVLENWIRAQFGGGSDKTEPVERDVYTITIGLWLSDDGFGTKSDTGNKDLTAGLVMSAWKKLRAGQATVEPW